MVKEVVQYIWMKLGVWEMNLLLFTVYTVVTMTVVIMKMPLFNAELVSNSIIISTVIKSPRNNNINKLT